MKKYIILIFCVLLSVYVGTSCKSSTDSNTPTKTSTPATQNANPSNLSKEMKAKVDANTAKKENERVTTAMMKRADALAKSLCSCANSANQQKCEDRAQKSYDATLKRLSEDKHAEFKTNFDAALAACK